MVIDVDVVARRLARWGAQARAMPRGAFDIAGQTHPLVALNGGVLGRIVPGRGVAIDSDLATLGITRPVTGVIERTLWMRTIEALADSRGAITSMATLRSAAADGNRQAFTKAFNPSALGSTEIAQTFDSGDSLAGQNFSVGPAAPTRTSIPGAWNAELCDPPTGKKKYLIGISSLAAGASAGFRMGLYVDMLSFFGNIATDSTALQSVTTSALTRYTTGEGVYLAMASQLSTLSHYAANSTFTVGYTNQAGTASRTCVTQTPNVASAQVIHADPSLLEDMFSFPLQAGDYGMRSIQSFTSSAASTDVGSKFGGMLYKPLVFLHGIPEPNVTVERDARAECEMLVELAVDGSGVLGYHTLLYATSTGNAVTIFTFDTCEG